MGLYELKQLLANQYCVADWVILIIQETEIAMMARMDSDNGMTINGPSTIANAKRNMPCSTAPSLPLQVGLCQIRLLFLCVCACVCFVAWSREYFMRIVTRFERKLMTRVRSNLVGKINKNTLGVFTLCITDAAPGGSRSKAHPMEEEGSPTQSKAGDDTWPDT